MFNIGPYRKAILSAIPVVVWGIILVIRIGNPEFAPGVDEAAIGEWISGAEVWIGMAATVAAPILTYLVPNAGFIRAT